MSARHNVIKASNSSAASNKSRRKAEAVISSFDKAMGLHSVLILAVGERDAANDFMANAAKVRYAKED